MLGQSFQSQLDIGWRHGTELRDHLCFRSELRLVIVSNSQPTLSAVLSHVLDEVEKATAYSYVQEVFRVGTDDGLLEVTVDHGCTKCGPRAAACMLRL